MLCTSEVVTNGVRHGRPEFVLSVRTETSFLEVALSDHGGQEPVKRDVTPADDDPRGRGLIIVDRIATA